MTEEAILRRVAPCGLDCGRCLDNPESPIARHARALRSELGGLGRRAAFFATLDPAFEDYAAFERLLERLGGGGCRGCRFGECLFAECRVKDCVKQRHVDFCFECEAFATCDPGLPPNLVQRWREANERMREEGLSAYARALDEKPRY